MKSGQMKASTSILAGFMLQLAVVFSVFSQVESVEKYTRPGMYATWIVVLLIGCVKHKGKIQVGEFTKSFFVSYVLFCLICFSTGMIDNNHFAANYLRVLIVPLLVTIVGDLYSREDKEIIDRVAKIYLLCSVVFAVWVQRTYFPSYTSWLSTRIYLFSEKNSAGQIWISAILISLFIIEKKNVVEKTIIYIACIYLLIMTGFSQCRTAILGLAVAIMAFAVSKAQHKATWIAIIFVIIIIAWQIPMVHQFVEQALFLNKYAGADLNTFSSGRIAHYKAAIDCIWKSPIVGVGKYYVDCSYLLILAESGLIGFFLIEWIWIKKIYISYLFRGDYREQSFLFILTTFYIVESILEGYPPFGPGVSSCMYWLLSSFIINRQISFKNQES